MPVLLPKPLFLLVSLFFAGIAAQAGAGGRPAEAAVLRCGWFENPTPGNAWLTDRDAEWTIGIQGGHQAEGDWPTFGARQWVATNRSYGHGCACMQVIADGDTHEIRRILSARARPLAACRSDPALKEPRP